MPRLLSAKVIFYLTLLLILDFCLMPIFRVGSVQPVLLYLMIPYASFQWHWEKTVPLAVIVGLFRDLTGVLPLGVETAALVGVTFLLDGVVQKIDRNAPITQLFLSFFYLSGVFFGGFILSGLIRGEQIMNANMFFGLLGSALMTAVAMPFFFYLTARWFFDKTAIKQYELFR